MQSWTAALRLASTWTAEEARAAEHVLGLVARRPSLSSLLATPPLTEST